jgi:hypothetical protein
MAEARVICAITAVGDAWEIDTVRPTLAAAVADLRRWSAAASDVPANASLASLAGASCRT